MKTVQGFKGGTHTHTHTHSTVRCHQLSNSHGKVYCTGHAGVGHHLHWVCDGSTWPELRQACQGWLPQFVILSHQPLAQLLPPAKIQEQCTNCVNNYNHWTSKT